MIEEACPSCGAPVADRQPFCGSCGRVQPARTSDYFEFLGLPRKLNLDLGSLESRYYRFSRKLHPDMYARASAREQEWSLTQASVLNDAYRTLKDPVARTKYLLRVEGVEFDDGGVQDAGKGNKSNKVPPDLLEQVFELNMQLEELRSARQAGGDDPEIRAGLDRARSGFSQELTSLDAQLSSAWKSWDTAVELGEELGEESAGEQKSSAKRRMTELLQRRSYLQNLLREVNQTLGETLGETLDEAAGEA